MSDRLHQMATDMRSYSMDLRNSGNRTRAILTEGVSIFPSLVGAGVGAINYGLDSHVVAKADRLEREYGYRPEGYVLNEARANVAAVDTAVANTAKKMLSRDGRAELGTPLVEWAHDFAAGDDLAAQKGITGFGEMLAGGALAKLKTQPKITTENPSGPSTLNVASGDNPLPGAVNVDIEMKQGVDVIADANALPFRDGQFERVVTNNPQGFNPLNSDVPRVVSDGGELIVTGNISNKNFKSVAKQSDEQIRDQGFEVVERKGPGEFDSNIAPQTPKQSDGRLINPETIRQLTLRKQKVVDDNN